MSSVSEDFTIDLRRLRVLDTLDRHGTVTATAAALHLTPSAVSQQIAGLARELGVPLLERRGRRVVLTGQARVVLRHAASVREQLDRARADLLAFDDGAVGEVRIGSLTTGITALVAPALRRLRESAPGLLLRVDEHESREALDLVEAGALDLAVIAEFSGSPASTDPRYHREDLIVDVLDVVLPAGHPAADPDGVELSALADEDWVGGFPGDACSQITFAACAAAGFSPQIRHSGHGWDGDAALVAAGAGVALIPRSAQPLRPPDLITCPVIGTPAARVLFALTRAGHERDPGLSTVLTELTAVAAAWSEGSAAPDAARQVTPPARARRAG